MGGEKGSNHSPLLAFTTFETLLIKLHSCSVSWVHKEATLCLSVVVQRWFFQAILERKSAVWMFGRSVTLEWSKLVPERCCNKKWTNFEKCHRQRENTDTLGWKDLFLIILRCWCLENRFWIADLSPFLLDDLNLPKQAWRCKKEAGVVTCWQSHLYILLNATGPAVLCWEKLTVVFTTYQKARSQLPLNI